MSEKYWDGENWLTVIVKDNSREYYLNGVKHRKDGPALIWYYYCGDILVEKYCINGKVHRKNKPAYIEYYKNNIVEREIYYYNGKKHNINGPAFIIYYNDDNIERKEFSFNGIKFEPEYLPFELPIDTEEKRFMFQLKYGDNNV